MPLVFRVGLFCTVLVMGGVRLLRSLREAGRLAPGRLPEGGRPRFRGGVGGERWIHLVVVWGAVLFCAPFLAAVALPDHAARLSSALDGALWGGQPVPAARPAPAAGAEGTRGPSSAERLAAGRRARAREMRAGFLMVLACGAGVAAADIAAGAARRRRRGGLVTAAAVAGIAASGAGIAFAGPAASRLAGSLQAARAIEEYWSAPIVRAADAKSLDGPVRVVGGPELEAAGESYLLLARPGWDRAAPVREAMGPFRLGRLRVPRAPPEVLRVVRPHVRLGAQGREVFMRADEDVMVAGFAVGGTLVPDPAWPAIVAPEGAPRVRERTSADLLGTARARGRLVAVLQALFAAALAWSLALLAATATERAVVRAEVSRPRADPAQADAPA